jgi:dephospho-CoA kinase
LTIVGVTGKYCSGKDTVTSMLMERGFPEINVDRLGHDALASERSRVMERFGQQITGPDGAIDRRKLGAIVFADRNALAGLESILHPVMVRMVEKRIQEHRQEAVPPPGVVVNAAILFRMKLDSLCDLVLFVQAPFVQRLRRARVRDGVGLLTVLRRLISQRDVTPQYSYSDADIQKVENDGSLETLRGTLDRLLSLP